MNDPNTLQIVFDFFHWYLATFIKVSRKIKTCAIALEKEMSTKWLFVMAALIRSVLHIPMAMSIESVRIGQARCEQQTSNSSDLKHKCLFFPNVYVCPLQVCGKFCSVYLFHIIL